MSKPSSTARVQALRERRSGLKRVEVYAHPDDAERIKRYAAKLARKRERLTQPAPAVAP